MNTKKKIIVVTGIVCIVLAVAGSAFVISGTACPFSDASGDNRSYHRGLPPFAREEMGKFVLWRLDQGIETLNLTQAQQQAYGELRTALKDSMETGLQKRGELRRLVHSQMAQDTFDVAVFTESVQDHLNWFSTLINNNLALFNTFYSMLDPGQKAQVNQTIKERFNQYHGRYDRMEEK